MCADLMMPVVPVRRAARFARASLLAVAAFMAFAAPQGAGAQTASFDDLRALRFYISQNDSAATQAELRRLRTAFPDWRPPSDLNQLLAVQAQPGVDEGEIWARIERRDYAAARRLIDEGRGRVAGWTPSADMLRVLETNEAQDSFDAAVASRDAGQAIAIARRSPVLMTCERINNAWLLADMYVLAGQKPAALTTWNNTLQSCTSYAQMETTLQKASAVAAPTELRALFDTARAANRGASGQLDRLWADLTGGSVPQASAQGQAPAAAATPQPAPQQPAPQQAAAPMPGGAPVRAMNLNLPLTGDGRLAEARRLKEQEQFARCLAATPNPRSMDVLYERSWCAYSHDRPTEALVGFTQAARVGDRLGPNVHRDAHFGMALSYLAMNMTEQGAQVAGQVALSETQRREIQRIVLDQRAVRAFRQQDYRQAISNLDALERLDGNLRRDLAILRAYAYLNNGDVDLARSHFERLHAQLATADTRRGLSLARGQ